MANSALLYNPGCFEHRNFGLIDIKVAMPYWSETFESIGVATDYTEISNRPFYHDIYSDRNGGREGQPSDMQYLGHNITISLELSAWDYDQIQLLKRRSVNATAGTILDSEVGTFMLAERSIRVCLDGAPTTDSSGAAAIRTRNFWCCMVREPIAVGLGTKHMAYRIQFTAYRPPCNHAFPGVLEDQNNDGFDANAPSTWSDPSGVPGALGGFFGLDVERGRVPKYASPQTTTGGTDESGAKAGGEEGVV